MKKIFPSLKNSEKEFNLHSFPDKIVSLHACSSFKKLMRAAFLVSKTKTDISFGFNCDVSILLIF